MNMNVVLCSYRFGAVERAEWWYSRIRGYAAFIVRGRSRQVQTAPDWKCLRLHRSLVRHVGSNLKWQLESIFARLQPHRGTGFESFPIPLLLKECIMAEVCTWTVRKTIHAYNCPKIPSNSSEVAWWVADDHVPDHRGRKPLAHGTAWVSWQEQVVTLSPVQSEEWCQLVV